MYQTNFITAPCEDVSLSFRELGNKPSSMGALYISYMKPEFIRIKPPLCACGCGGYTEKCTWKKNIWNRYILGHARKGKPCTEIHKQRVAESKAKYAKPIPKPLLCACGCGQLATVHKHEARKYAHGHNRRNVHTSDETKQKLRKQKLGELNPSKRIEIREQISQTLRVYYSDFENIKKNGNWMGGISYEPYGKEFNKELKELVREKYNRICRYCGKSEIELKTKLCVHHIDYNKKNNSPNNLLPLCNKCHSKTNRNREYWTIFYQNIINQKYGKNKAHKTS